jgi:hypothetical protein
MTWHLAPVRRRGGLSGLALGLGLLLALGAGACKDEPPCDSTSYFMNGVCWRLPPDAGAVAGGGGGAEAGAGAADAPAGPTFGTPCKDSLACGGAANLCFKRSSDDAGACSALCAPDRPGACPAGWTCCPLDKLDPTAPMVSGCVPPEIKCPS